MVATMMVQQLRAWALYLAGQGWSVFPLKVGGKRPALPRRDWQSLATTDPTRIRQWWAQTPFNIGVATGPSGLVVVDLDTAKDGGELDGAAVLAELVRDRGVRLPDTYTVATPSGGRHLYFRTPVGVQLGVTAGRRTPDGRVLGLGPRVDTRAAGGYVVGPGSCRAEGGYELVDDTEPAELPAWVVQVLTERSAPEAEVLARPVAKPGRYAVAAIERETARVRRAGPGSHNAAVNIAAYRLGRLVGRRLLALDVARAALRDAASVLADGSCECTSGELAGVIEAGLKAGCRKAGAGQNRLHG